MDLCESLRLSPNTVKKTIREMATNGTPIEPYPSGTMKLYTPDQVKAIREFRETATTAT